MTNASPPIIHTIEKVGSTWRLTRWDYEGAPLVAERIPKVRHSAGYSVEIDKDGLCFDGLEEYTSPFVPTDVLRLLIEDAKARGVL